MSGLNIAALVVTSSATPVQQTASETGLNLAFALRRHVLKHRVKQRGAKAKAKAAARLKRAKDAPHVEQPFVETVPENLQFTFRWAQRFVDRLCQPADPADTDRAITICGHFEFAGGGAAEVAAAALSQASSSPKLNLVVKTQSDWDKMKMRALEANNTDSCKFGDICNAVVDKTVFNDKRERLAITQDELLYAMQLRRCLIREPEPDCEDRRCSEAGLCSLDLEAMRSEEEADLSDTPVLAHQTLHSSSSSGSTSSSSSVPAVEKSDVSAASASNANSGSSDESEASAELTSNANSECYDEDMVLQKLRGLFDSKHRLRFPVGRAGAEWTLLGVGEEEEDFDRSLRAMMTVITSKHDASCECTFSRRPGPDTLM